MNNPSGFINPQTNSGSIGSSPNPRRFEDTLDEPVATTIIRDLNNVWKKMKQVIVPKGEKDILRDWDLWGPLLLCLILAIRLGAASSANQSATVFTIVFVIIWLGGSLVTVNSKLLGGKMSFFQSVCVLGYCIFPLVISSFVCLFIGIFFIKIIIITVGFVWSITAAVGFLADAGLSNRRALAMYPILLFYFILAWLILLAA